MTRAGADRLLRLLLRVMGTSSLTAVFFVAVPRAWMAAIHTDLGLGPMPDAPIVFYLARSTSAFYAIAGGLFWLVSYDLERHRRVVAYLATVGVLLGLALFAIDLGEGLPRFWTLWEGPFVLAFALVTLLLNRAGARPG